MLFILCCCCCRCSFSIFFFSLLVYYMFIFSYFMFMPILITHTASLLIQCEYAMNIRFFFLLCIFLRAMCLKDAWKRKSNFFTRMYFCCLDERKYLLPYMTETLYGWYTWNQRIHSSETDWRVLKGCVERNGMYSERRLWICW